MKTNDEQINKKTQIDMKNVISHCVEQLRGIAGGAVD